MAKKVHKAAFKATGVTVGWGRLAVMFVLS